MNTMNRLFYLLLLIIHCSFCWRNVYFDLERCNVPDGQDIDFNDLEGQTFLLYAADHDWTLSDFRCLACKAKAVSADEMRLQCKSQRITVTSGGDRLSEDADSYTFTVTKGTKAGVLLVVGGYISITVKTISMNTGPPSPSGRKNIWIKVYVCNWEIPDPWDSYYLTDDFEDPIHMWFFTGTQVPTLESGAMEAYTDECNVVGLNPNEPTGIEEQQNIGNNRARPPVNPGETYTISTTSSTGTTTTTISTTTTSPSGNAPTTAAASTTTDSTTKAATTTTISTTKATTTTVSTTAATTTTVSTTAATTTTVSTTAATTTTVPTTAATTTIVSTTQPTTTIISTTKAATTTAAISTSTTTTTTTTVLNTDTEDTQET